MSAPRPHEILHHELIGLEAEVLEDSNPCNIKIKGTVLDETMNTITIDHDGAKCIAKENAVFKFMLNGEAVKVEGAALNGRPEDRVKKTIKRRW
jgi:ribonuclease P protein subunit POP4